MKFTAEIEIMPHKGLLDPQGKAVSHSMENIGLAQISGVRIGKFITAEVEASNPEEAKKWVEEACKKLLVNPIMESFHIRISQPA